MGFGQEGFSVRSGAGGEERSATGSSVAALERRSAALEEHNATPGRRVATLEEPNAAPEKPNMVIIVSDDHAFQAIGAYGSTLMQTPHMDRIAREGAVFNRAYVTNSICGPSRAVILTGKYSHKNGFRDNDNSKFDASQDSFVKRLRAGGYQTAWVGKYHLHSDPQGFDYWKILPGQGAYYNPDFLVQGGGSERIEGYVTNVISDLAEDFLDNRDADKPFCLVIGHKATHRTWVPDTADLRMFDTVNFALPANFYDTYEGRPAAKVQDMTIANTLQLAYDLKMFSFGKSEQAYYRRLNEAQRRAIDDYYGPIEADLKARNLSGRALTEWKFQRYMRDYLSTAASLDRNVGRVLDYLDQHNLARNTIVIYMSDQGFYLGEHGWFDKRFMYEESFRTPMLMRYPGVVAPGSVNNDFVMNLDIGPTMLDAAGLPVPAEMQGRSFLPLFGADGKKAGRKEMFYHYYENGEHAVSPQFGIRTERYKLIRYYKRVEAWELFDLKKDPSEMHNLFDNRKYRKTALRLKKELDKLIAEYEDPDAAAISTDDPLFRPGGR